MAQNTAEGIAPSQIDDRLKSPLPFLATVGHGLCAVGLAVGYSMVYNNGNTNSDVWNDYLNVRRGLIAGGVTLGILNVLTRRSIWSTVKVSDPAKRYSLLWVGRALHSFVAPAVLIAVELFGPEYAQYGLLATISTVAVNDLGLAFKQLYLASLIQELVTQVKSKQKVPQKWVMLG